MIINLKKMKYLSVITIILLLYIPISLSFKYHDYSISLIRTISILSLLIYLIEIFIIFLLSGKLFTPTVLFLASFYVFQNGQIILFALGFKFYDFYINMVKELLTPITIFSSISNVICGYAAIIFTKVSYNNKIKKNKAIDKLSENYIYKISKLFFIITCSIALPLVIIKFVYVINGGYSSVRSFEGTIPSYINIIEYLFAPFSILNIVYSKENNNTVVKFIFAIWGLITALCGDRTTGISTLMILIYLSNVKNSNIKQKNNINFIKTMKYIIAIVIITVLIQYSYSFRNRQVFEINSYIDIITNTISELGFNFFPLYVMMSIVPKYENFLFGKGYLYSFLGGIFPESLDISGTISVINSKSRIFEMWQYKYFSQFDFGFGFSLNAEAYINFGWYGLISLFIILAIIFYMLNSYNPLNKTDYWGLYRSTVLLFLFFTLPRRDSYYLWKSIVYSLILIKYLILFINAIYKKGKLLKNE